MVGTMVDLPGLHRNHRAFWRHMARVCGGTAEEVPGGLIVDTGIGVAPYNQVHCRADADEATVIDAAAAYFARRGLPWRIICERPSPAAEAFGGRHGVAQDPPYPIMSMAIGSSVAPPPVASLEVETARDMADLRAFVDCAAAGYRLDPALIRPLAHRRAVEDPDLRFYLGRLDGRCVAVSIGVRDGDTIGVYFVGVRRGHRRRGFGGLLTRRAIQDGADDGARTAVLQATSAGYPLYLGMGFQKVADYHLWDIPATAGTGYVG
jgi:GNAT superfamily N-acetyltransferase